MKKIRLADHVRAVRRPVCVAGIAAAQPQQKNIILATTTSTQDSGLLDVLSRSSRRRPATS